MSPNAGRDSGLQVERTELSWERSAFGFLVGGALVLLRDDGPFAVTRIALAAVAGALVVTIMALVYRRSHGITVRSAAAGAVVVSPARFEVTALGYATAGFAFAMAAALLWGML